MSSKICHTYEELSDVIPEWNELAKQSEPNVFYEPALFLPAFKYLRGSEKPFVVLIYDDRSRGRLLGLFPMVVKSSFQRLPVRHIANWRYVHAFFCAPLVVRGYEKQCLSELFYALNSAYPSIRSYGFELLDRESAFFEGLHSNEHCARFDQSYERAQLDIRECDPATVMKSSHRKDLRRRERKLSQLGDLTIELNEASQSIDEWIEDFLALEEGGWKGQNDTALNCNSNEKSFFVEAMCNAASTGNLRITSIRLDGELVASTCDVASGDRSFAFKITYDEKHRKLSPGILIVLKHVERLVAEGQFKWADSCAQENSEMANRVYAGRRSIASVLFSTRRTVASYIISSILPRFVKLKRRLRQRSGG